MGAIRLMLSAAVAAALIAGPGAAHAQVPAQPAGTAAQREAVGALLDGEWRGQAVVHVRTGPRP
jgi:hypothetical protein